MAEPNDQSREVITYRIPRIEIYEVTADDLSRIEEQYGQVGLDLTFAISSLSFLISFVIAIVCSPNLPSQTLNLFYFACVICAVVFLYTGIRWIQNSGRAATAIQKIRSRKEDPAI